MNDELIRDINSENCFSELSNAIVLQAVKDYKKAIEEQHMRVINECEDFFRSKWFSTLTSIDGELIISKIGGKKDELQ